LESAQNSEYGPDDDIDADIPPAKDTGFKENLGKTHDGRRKSLIKHK